MADPFTLTAISLATTAASAGVSAYGAYSQGQAQAGQYAYQAQIAKMNAQIAEQNANYATAAGEVSAQEAGMKERFQRGQTIAQQGAGGLAVGQGSNARVVTSELAVGQQDQALIRSNAARQAYGYRVQAASDTAQGALDTTAASNAKTAGDIGAFGSLLSGAASVSSKWVQASNAGVFSGGGGGSGTTFGTRMSYDDTPSSVGR